MELNWATRLAQQIFHRLINKVSKIIIKIIHSTKNFMLNNIFWAQIIIMSLWMNLMILKMCLLKVIIRKLSIKKLMILKVKIISRFLNSIQVWIIIDKKMFNKSKFSFWSNCKSKLTILKKLKKYKNNRLLMVLLKLTIK